MLVPMQNAYIESFNGNFRDECLNKQGWGFFVFSTKSVGGRMSTGVGVVG